MIKQTFLPLIALVALCCAGAATAHEDGKPHPHPAGTPELLKRKPAEEAIVTRLQKARPDIKFSSVRPSPIAGLYQVQVVGGPLLYVTPEGDKFIAGEIFSVGDSGFAKLEDPALVEERKKLLASINPKDAITFKAKGKTKAVVYVFTDVDCGYCRRLNAQMNTYDEQGQKKPGYTDLGIEVRYLAYPRAGIPSPSADKLITAWCSKDQQKALTLLKEDQSVPSATCANPVAAQFELGGQIGVNGTPAIWLPNGELKPGYLPPDALAKELGIL
ncbi:MAG TPA: DsbC family protein [Cellvibrio sp.]|nr:DsbC family protein [Cellvibrio sp.]